MTPVAERLRSLARAERRTELESVVAAEFKVALLMTEDEELPLEDSFFELGLTSLALTDVKQRLETLLGRAISSTAMFNRPTVEQLVDHLATDVLAELFDADAATPQP
ncbi:acyl carrier protein [Streptomyces spinoverrucosus]|uniref:acyl carrier protein n=1 Tax=Streptomyces spinoverrucosus TaxID=284043 RepID=UPI0018C43FF9|nr:acyl carrier protein [Streptomyces spinoverrucosus]MBG0851772.1 acyl carrier protein [Streptomyces spinoverrucosus]